MCDIFEKIKSLLLNKSTTYNTYYTNPGTYDYSIDLDLNGTTNNVPVYSLKENDKNV